MGSSVCNKCFVTRAEGQDCPQCAADVGRVIPADTLPQGTLLNDCYPIGRLLGRGGFGATYLARDAKLETRVAIKEFLPNQAVSRDGATQRVVPYPQHEDAFAKGLAQFLDEARKLAKFRDFANIITVLTYFEANATAYMVMEYLDGEPLDAYVRAAGRLDMRTAFDVMRPVADALRACHEENLIHRDVSPDNIFITRDGRVKLLDFGAARFAIGNANSNLSIILKEGYAPFEQYQRNGRQGTWTDVYAFTATLYRLLTGTLPPTAPERIGGAELPRLTGIIDSPPLQALIDKGMALNIDARFQTMGEILGAMSAIPEAVAPPQPIDLTYRPTIAVAGNELIASDMGRKPPPHTDPVAHETGRDPSGGDSAFSAILLRHRTATLVAAGAVLLATVGVAADGGYFHRGPAHTPVVRDDGTTGTTPSDTSSVRSTRVAVMDAAQKQFEIQIAMENFGASGRALRAWEGFTEKNSSDASQIRQLRLERDGADAERNKALGEYVEKIESISQRDPVIVGTALTLERNRTAVPTTDQDRARNNKAMRKALDQVEAHLRANAGHTLTDTMIMNDVRNL